MLIDRLRYVERLRKPGAVHPRDAVANLEACVLDAACHAVIRPRPGEGEEVPAGLEDAVRLSRPRAAELLKRERLHRGLVYPFVIPLVTATMIVSECVSATAHGAFVCLAALTECNSGTTMRC